MRFIAEESERLDRFVSKCLPEHSRSKLTKLIDSGEILVGGKAVKAAYKLTAGEEVDIPEVPEAEPHDLTPADIYIEVVYEDDHLMVINKPRGLASHPAASLKEPSLVNALLNRGQSLSQTAGSFRPGIVHRLDKETTGLMVVAKTDAAHVILAKQIESKSAERRYFAVVAGDLDRDKFVIDAAMARSKVNRQLMAVDPDGKRAITHVHKIARNERGTTVAIRLETGRTHQIRVHMRAIGHPILGDNLYAPKEWAHGTMQLHAAYLAFDHPVSGERIVTYVDPPADFQGVGQVSRKDAEGFDVVPVQPS